MRKVLMALVACAALGAQADTAAPPEDETTPDNDSDLPAWANEQIDPFHESVSRWVDTSSRRIDGFFGTTDALTVESDSFLRLSQAWRWREGESLDQDLGVRFRLDLPTTEERLRLIIETEPEETRGTLAEQDDQLADERISGVESLRIGLNRLSRRDRTERWNTQVGAGIRVRLPLDPFARVISQRLWTLNDGPWQLESDNRLSWFNKDGYSARTRWDLGRPLDEQRHLRFITNVQWREEVDKLEFSEAAELNRRLNRRSALRYTAAVLGESGSRPRIEDSYLEVRYRRDVHRGILFLDVAPALHFPREVDYDSRWEVNLRLEMYFRRQFDRTVL
ncbi:hypothetical protein BDK63_003578 [Halomonas campaniensis]|uniref:Uncharacterized protein n=1 Tax=Halomonas campaniensis TaxID=213554 RepID=A0A7W5PCC2_9GAMM|nr:hypothetical protein [Halomonas campaniensis]MBB3332678.1 hypothetical protein [Halomonas campaniensis]